MTVLTGYAGYRRGFAPPRPLSGGGRGGSARLRATLSRALERGLRAHPVLTTAAALLAVGFGMVGTLVLAVTAIVVPIYGAAALL